MHLRAKVGARCTGRPFVLYTGALVNGVTMLVVELAVVVGLIVLNGFLAMSELALVPPDGRSSSRWRVTDRAAPRSRSI